MDVREDVDKSRERSIQFCKIRLFGFRSMEVCIETRDIDRTHEALRGIFARQGFTTELREINRTGEECPTGKVVYHLKLSPVIDMDKLSEQIIAADRQNIGSVGWEQKKSTTYGERHSETCTAGPGT